MRALVYFVKLKFARYTLPSTSLTINCRLVPAHALSVFHTYVYGPLAPSYVGPLCPAVSVGVPPLAPVVAGYLGHG